MSYTPTLPYTFARLLRFLNVTNDAINPTEKTTLFESFNIWINEAFERIRLHCNQTIQATSQTISIDFNRLGKDEGGYYVILPVLKLPITITSVTYKTDIFDTATTIGSSYYSLVNYNGIQKLYFQYPPTNSVAGYVNCTVGFTDANMPELIQQVAVEMVAEIHEESKTGKNRLGVATLGESMQGAGVNTAYYQLTPRHEKLLNPYQLLTL